MKLMSVQIRNYKCIENSGDFSIDDVTCLAGKNESGKTAILQALRHLNPVESVESDFDDLEYPRHLLDSKTDNDHVIEAHWKLLADDKAELENIIGPNSFSFDHIISKKGYDNTLIWEYELDISSFHDHLKTNIQSITDEAENSGLCLTILQDILLVIMDTADLDECFDEYVSEGSIYEDIETYLEEILPKFLYFPMCGTLSSKVLIDDLWDKANAEELQTEQDRFAFALLSLAGTNIEELVEAQTYEEFKGIRERISNNLSKKFTDYWSQNEYLKVEFDQGESRDNDPDIGRFLSFRIEDIRLNYTVSFDERSAGFIWYFSFFVWFSYMEEMYGNRLIILLDEPGVSLHGAAQQDLLRYIKDKLLPRYQVIYTTHSPFMIDTNSLSKVRTVEHVFEDKGKLLGTKIENNVLSRDSDTLFPLRAALGYGLTQSLFVGEYVLLVEGISDMYYLRWASRQLISVNREGLDLRWTITPVDGITKFSSFISLFASNDLTIVVFTDYHRGDKQKVLNLERSEQIDSSAIFKACDFTDTPEADIEDMLGYELYVELINKCYKLEGKNRLSDSLIDMKPPITKPIKDHFNTLGSEVEEYKHLPPALYLLEHATNFSDNPGLEKALDRFEQFFKAVNKLLPS